MSRQEVKSKTSIGNGLSNGAANISASSPILKNQVSTGSRNPHFAGENDSPTTLTGQGDGIPVVGGSTLDKKYGYVSPSGSRIEIDDTAGNETVNIQHHSGASAVIDPDGSIHIISSSRKGVGISAPFGDAYVSGAGDVVIEGAALSFRTTGDFNLDVGGNINMVSAGVKLKTKNMDQTIDGHFSSSVTNDYSEVVGGIMRQTVAGDKRNQITGANVLDVKGNNTTRITGDNDFNVKGDNTSKIDGDSTESVTGNITQKYGGDMSVSIGGTLGYGIEGSAEFGSKGNLTVSSEGIGKFSAPTSIIAGNSIDVNASGNANLQAGGQARVVGDTASIGGNSVVIATADLTEPAPTISAGSDSPSSQTVDTPPDREDADSADEAKVMEANDIVDSLTSIRQNPDYPNNALHESAEAGSISLVSHDQTTGAESAYNQYSSRNAGSLNSFTEEEIGNFPNVSESNRRSDIQAITPDISVPSRHDTAAKISRFYTLGDLLNAPFSHKIPSSTYKTVVQNHIFAAYNVLDPIRERFPDVMITSAYRKNSSNHITGLAIDMQVKGRILSRHAEIAAFVRDNLPVDQIFLEKSGSGKTHVHIRASNSGGAPTVLTCGDKRCTTKTAGIDVSFLKRSGAR